MREIPTELIQRVAKDKDDIIKKTLDDILGKGWDIGDLDNKFRIISKNGEGSIVILSDMPIIEFNEPIVSQDRFGIYTITTEYRLANSKMVYTRERKEERRIIV